MKAKHIIAIIPFLLLGCSDSNTTQELKQRLIGGQKEERVIPVGIQSIDYTDGIVSNS